MGIAGIFLFCFLYLGNFGFDRTREYLEEVAVNVARNLASGKLKVDRQGQKSFVRKATDHVLSYGVVREQVFKKAHGQVMKLTNGLYPAPLRILEVSFLTIKFFDDGNISGSFKVSGC